MERGPIGSAGTRVGAKFATRTPRTPHVRGYRPALSVVGEGRAAPCGGDSSGPAEFVSEQVARRVCGARLGWSSGLLDLGDIGTVVEERDQHPFVLGDGRDLSVESGTGTTRGDNQAGDPLSSPIPHPIGPGSSRAPSATFHVRTHCL